MADLLKNLRARIEEKKEKEKTESARAASEEEANVNPSQVEDIVRRMKEKYQHEGLQEQAVEGKLGELRDIITGTERKTIELQTVEELQEFHSPLVRRLGGLYLKLKKPMDWLSARVAQFPQMKMLNYYLYSADMPYSSRQWVALTTISAFIVFILSVLLGTVVFNLLPPLKPQYKFLSFLVPLAIGIVLFFITVLMGFLIPQSNAQKRGEKISAELPFALRHMATELRAGIGLYRTIETIAKADYGVLSEEFAKTIREIEEGTDTKDALRHFAARSQSKALQTSLRHVIRALKTGGNLSEIMSTIASEVSFDLRTKIRDFSEKMNFFGVIFIFIGIVMPVFVGILSAIVNAPTNLPLTLPLTPIFTFMFYVAIMPFILAFLIFYLYIIQPKV
ncbi:MAG: type II secretion system F family protein [Candidatus Diapherotrites archaeon]|nr:type II secretion system F family protein [Candidatus Diapherotrites archaeon]